jgi:hypothetical protein
LPLQPETQVQQAASLKHDEGAQGQLFLFQAADLRSAWKLHPASPVSSHARYARNGGALFRLGSQLIRVSQDSVPSYGRRLHFYAIESLTPDHYRERLLGTRDAEWSPDFRGAHSYDRGRIWEVTDGLRLVAPAAGG